MSSSARTVEKAVYGVIAIWLMAFPAFALDSTAGTDGQIGTTFQPGYGTPIGHILLVDKTAFIVHQQIEGRFQAREALPLYVGDSLSTGVDARLSIKLDDGSQITLGPQSNLVLDKNVFDPGRQTRSSFFKLLFGKARFYAYKLVQFRTNEFKVKTRTVIVGVRGSDFIVRADAQSTQVTALEDTRIEVVGLAALDAAPTLLTDFERSTIELGAQPSLPERVSMDEIEALKQELRILLDEKPEIEITASVSGKQDAKSGKAESAGGILVAGEPLAESAPEVQSDVNLEKIVPLEIPAAEEVGETEETISVAQEQASETAKDTGAISVTW